MKNETCMNIIDQAEKLGFEAAVIKYDQLVFEPEYRKYCEENLCGNFEMNYSCPNYSGTVEEMKARTKDHAFALALKRGYSLVDAVSDDVKKYKKSFNADALHMITLCREQKLWEHVLPILSGPCNLCAPCLMPKGEACPHPEERWSCMSAYCIDVNKLAEAAGMTISWDLDQVGLFGIILFNLA